MPAHRSRTDRWKDCLFQLRDRGGALEFTLPASNGADLLWRVRVLEVDDEAVTVERPSAAGQTIDLAPGLDLIAVMQIGQNRWIFRTRTLSPASRGLRLALPQVVERCQRRNFYRVSTAQVSLPAVECWPLLDPTSVAVAEVANRAQILELQARVLTGGTVIRSDEPSVLPEVGPRFPARLVNVGGGGVGLLVARSDAPAAERARFLWLRIHLMPHIPAPIAMTARVAHTHIDSEQNLYAGLAFEFDFNPTHRQFVVEQICRYVAALQQQRTTEQRRVA